MGWNKKIPPRRMPKTKSAAPPAPTKHTVPCDNFGVRRGGGGVPPPPPPPLGSGPGQGQPPWAVARAADQVHPDAHSESMLGLPTPALT